jgi:hypothetical protein
MGALRVLLLAIFTTIVLYTAVVISNHGLNLLPVFFGDIAEMDWAGQFNLDFSGFLTLSALWLAWRHHFSPLGLGLGVLGFFGGAPVVTAYLLIVSFSCNGDAGVLLLGPIRAARGPGGGAAGA